MLSRGGELHPLCFEHDIEMEQANDLFSCPVPGCAIRYASATGYLLYLTAIAGEPPTLPRVVCPCHGTPMYLAEVLNQKFRLWRCPECGRRRNNHTVI